MRQHRGERIRRIVGSHRNKTDVELAFDPVREDYVNFHVEWTVGHVHLQSLLVDGGHMLLVDIDERYIIAGAREAAADNPADRSGANDDHAHSCVDTSVAIH